MKGFCKKLDLSPQNETKLMLGLFILLFTYLGVRTHPTHPLPTGLSNAHNVICLTNTCSGSLNFRAFNSSIELFVHSFIALGDKLSTMIKLTKL